MSAGNGNKHGGGGVIDRKFNVMWLDTLISYLIGETGFIFFIFTRASNF